MKENISSNVFRKRRDKDEENSSTNSFSIVEICNSKAAIRASRSQRHGLEPRKFREVDLGREEMKGYSRGIDMRALWKSTERMAITGCRESYVSQGNAFSTSKTSTTYTSLSLSFSFSIMIMYERRNGRMIGGKREPLIRNGLKSPAVAKIQHLRSTIHVNYS